MAGLYEGREHKNQPPFDISNPLAKAQGQLDLKRRSLRLHGDIIGGNSGSPSSP